MVIKINHLESLQNRLDQIYKWVTPGPIQSSPSLTVRRLELPGNAKEVVRGHCPCCSQITNTDYGNNASSLT